MLDVPDCSQNSPLQFLPGQSYMVWQCKRWYLFQYSKVHFQHVFKHYDTNSPLLLNTIVISVGIVISIGQTNHCTHPVCEFFCCQPNSFIANILSIVPTGCRPWVAILLHNIKASLSPLSCFAFTVQYHGSDRVTVPWCITANKWSFLCLRTEPEGSQSFWGTALWGQMYSGTNSWCPVRQPRSFSLWFAQVLHICWPFLSLWYSRLW